MTRDQVHRPAVGRAGLHLIARAGLAVLVGAGLAACTSSGPSRPGPSPDAPTKTIIATRTATASASPFTPAPASSRAPLPPHKKPPAGEVAKRCPYIATGLNQDTSGRQPNLADIEGDRVGRTTVLTRLRPVGCRFYFYGGGYEGVAYEAIAEIHPQTFASTAAAHNAMVLTARTGTEAYAEPDVVKGVDGIGFRTKFFGPDGAKDWAFAFAKGKVMVVVYTQVTVSSRNALYIAQAIAAKF